MFEELTLVLSEERERYDRLDRVSRTVVMVMVMVMAVIDQADRRESFPSEIVFSAFLEISTRWTDSETDATIVRRI
jgi:hypothetical protein